MRRWVWGLALVVLMGGVGGAEAAPLIYGSAYGSVLGNPAASLYNINPATGAATLVGPIGFDMVGALAFNPATGILYGEGVRPSDTTSVLLTINTTTGAGTVVGSLGIGDVLVQDITFRRSDAVLYAYISRIIETINTTTGLASRVGDTGSFPFGNGLAFSPANTLYTANEANLRTVNQTTGAVTFVTNLNYPIPPVDLGPRTNGMDFDPATGILYASIVNGIGGANTNYLGTINIATGAVTVIGQTVTGLDAIAIQPAVVPEPASAVLGASAALAGLGCWWRRRRVTA